MVSSAYRRAVVSAAVAIGGCLDPNATAPGYPAYVAIQRGTTRAIPVDIPVAPSEMVWPRGVASVALAPGGSVLSLKGLARGFARWDPWIAGYPPMWLAVLDSARTDPILLGHHGVPSVAPENTLASIGVLCQLGMPGVEVDVRFTADGVPVLIHDRSVARTSNGTGYVDEMTLAQLRQLDFGSWYAPQYAGERIPTLREFAELGRSCRLDVVQLDVKSFAPLGVDSGWARVAREFETADWRPRLEVAAAAGGLSHVERFIPGVRTLVFLRGVDSASAEAVISERITTVGVAIPGYGPSGAQLLRLQSLGVTIGVWGATAPDQLIGLVPAPDFVTTDWPWSFR
jgi:hypothetical protein